MGKLSVLGVCGAQGALLFKFRKNLIANIEPRSVFHTTLEEQWRLNFGETPFLRNLGQLKTDKKVDIIIGSPSCGHSSVFSYSRKKSLGVPKEDESLSMYITSIKTLKPKIFLLENLPKLLELYPVEQWESILDEYEIIKHCHSVSYFGNSQVSRKRLILIGVIKGLKVDKSIFKVAKAYGSLESVRELYTKVREPLNFREDDDKKLAMYHYKDVQKKTLTVAQVRNLWQKEFKGEYKWPMKSQKMKTLPGVYRNRWDAYPLTARPSNRQFNPDGDIMGLEEYRVIMGFPKNYQVYYNPNRGYYWLNKGRNTLTKGSVYEVGLWFYRCIKTIMRNNAMVFKDTK